MLTIYRFLGILLIPLIKFNILLRILKKKEDKSRYIERFGTSCIHRPEGNLVWIHAASIGEFKSANFLINKLQDNFKVLVTTTTLSAANFAQKEYGKKIIHQYAPLDIHFWVNKFLDKWNPQLVIWIESDLWPTTMNLLKKKSINSLLVNVRISPHSFYKWKKIKFFYKQMTECFSEIFAQSLLDKKRIEELTSRNVKYIGNLKLYSNSIYTDSKNDENLSQFINNKVLMLASTHNDEEFQFLPIIKKLLSKINNLKVIIAPRHPERSDSILSMYQNKGISSKLLNNNDNFSENEDVMIINHFGNLPKYFKISDIVFLGGSFVMKGGHNPIEPAVFNCAIMTGPHIFNWQNIYEDMSKNNACLIFDKIQIFEKNVVNLYNNINLLNTMKKNSNTLANKKFFDSEKLINSINDIMETKTC